MFPECSCPNGNEIIFEKTKHLHTAEGMTTSTGAVAIVGRDETLPSHQLFCSVFFSYTFRRAQWCGVLRLREFPAQVGCQRVGRRHLALVASWGHLKVKHPRKRADGDFKGEKGTVRLKK